MTKTGKLSETTEAPRKKNMEKEKQKNTPTGLSPVGHGDFREGRFPAPTSSARAALGEEVEALLRHVGLEGLQVVQVGLVVHHLEVPPMAQKRAIWAKRRDGARQLLINSGPLWVSYDNRII